MKELVTPRKIFEIHKSELLDNKLQWTDLDHNHKKVYKHIAARFNRTIETITLINQLTLAEHKTQKKPIVLCTINGKELKFTLIVRFGLEYALKTIEYNVKMNKNIFKKYEKIISKPAAPAGVAS